MPTIDAELFQLIVLGLLAVNLLAILGILSALSKIRQAVADRGGAADVGVAAAPVATQPAAQAWAQPEPAATTASYASPIGGATTGGATAGGMAGGGPGAGGFAGGMGAATGGLEPAPGAAPLGTAGAAPAGTATAATPAAAEPSDQPFERDGRWWFRRGEELLLYDEATGQWQPAPAGAGGGAPGYAPGPVAGAGVEQAGGVGGSFWKCPACGAVNGSTATSCRMCFTARP